MMCSCQEKRDMEGTKCLPGEKNPMNAPVKVVVGWSERIYAVKDGQSLRNGIPASVLPPLARPDRLDHPPHANVHDCGPHHQ